MKCSAKLIYYKKLTKSGKRKLFTSLSYNWSFMSWRDSLPTKTQDKLDLGGFEICDGKIVAEIGCHAEPTFNEDGDTYPELDVNFICEKCGQHNHPDLPQEEIHLNEWLTEIIEKM